MKGRYFTQEMAGITHATCEITFRKGRTYTAQIDPQIHRKYGYMAINGWWGKFHAATKDIADWKKGSYEDLYKTARSLLPETEQLLRDKGYLD